MQYLADTVTLVRHLSKTGKIGKAAKRILEDTDKGHHHIFISVIALVEILYLSERQRIPIKLGETLNSISYSQNYSVVNLTPEIVKVAASSACKELHDRLILSIAKYLGVSILTSDQAMKDLNEVPTIWQ
ncbi:MAG: type II toxin-antitoxin system VapC family toxin [bacterium]